MIVVSEPSELNKNKLALVVDDSKMQCEMLSVLLQEEGYRVIVAHDGACGVASYLEYHPDLVLMDIIMPIMNGFEAARQIKKISKDSLAPLIFITSHNTDQNFIDSIEAGGDQVLVRPFSTGVFKATIKSIQRVSNLYNQVKSLQQEQHHDQKLAEQLTTSLIGDRNYALDKIGIVKKAAAVFSGDIQLSVLCPNGDINILLGDFTGHGLRSSIGAIPLTEIFRTMTKKGFRLLDIIKQINRQFYNLLPADLFLAAAFVCVSSQDKMAYIFNAGLPSAYIYSGEKKIKHVINSQHPPLGILPDLLPNISLNIFNIREDDRIILISDGVIEARNAKAEMFSIERFESVVEHCDFSQNIAMVIMQTINTFCKSTRQEDDISIIDMPCNIVVERNIKLMETDQKPFISVDISDELLSQTPLWKWQLTLSAEKLATVNPVPIIMGQIQSIEDSTEHWHNLQTILTELFVNALDHGVLELDSSLKDPSAGFVEYFNEREKRLAALTQGFISVYLEYYALKSGGRMLIKIKDSGKGFNVLEKFKKISLVDGNRIALSGRGLALVNELVETLQYHENGSLVEAAYIWQ